MFLCLKECFWLLKSSVCGQSVIPSNGSAHDMKFAASLICFCLPAALLESHLMLVL